MTRIMWTQRQDIGPSARSGAALAFDSIRSRTVLFGGKAADGAKADTWEWEDTLWTQVQDSGPVARANAVMAHGDAGIILFGGRLSAVAGGFRAGDTWSWDGTDWTQLADTGPSPRNRAALAFDWARSQYVLFGGVDDDGELDDTWTFDGTAWTQVANTGPSPRTGHAMAYDAAREQVVLFGGLTGGQPDGQTWAWDGNGWTQEQNAGPLARYGHVMAGDASSVWLFGGGSTLVAGGVELHGDSWEWDGSNWTQRQDIGPSPRIDANAAFDSGRQRILLFGGAVDSTATPDLIGDTWEARIAGDSPDAGGPSPDFTIDASEMMVAGSPLGLVTLVLATPPSTDWPVSVAVNGVVENIPSPPIRAGQTGSWALFNMTAHGPGSLSVRVTVGTKVEDAAVTVVGGPHRLQSVTIAPTTVMRPGMAHASVTGSWAWGTALLVSITSLSVDGFLGQVQIIPPSQGPVTVAVPIPPTVRTGTHRLVAIAKSGPGPTGVSVAGPVEITVA